MENTATNSSHEIPTAIYSLNKYATNLEGYIQYDTKCREVHAGISH